MLTFVRRNRQPTSEITNLLAYCLLACHHATGRISICYVKLKLYKHLYILQSKQ